VVVAPSIWMERPEQRDAMDSQESRSVWIITWSRAIDLCRSLKEASSSSLRAEGDCRRPYGYNLQATPGKRLMTPTDRITINPQQCGGRPCVRGMRIRVSDVLDLLAAGLSPAEVVADLPDLEIEDVIACLKFASLQASQPGAAA